MRSRGNTPRDGEDTAAAEERRKQVWYCREFHDTGKCSSGKGEGEKCSQGPHRTKQQVLDYMKANPTAIPMPQVFPKAKTKPKSKAKPKPKAKAKGKL